MVSALRCYCKVTRVFVYWRWRPVLGGRGASYLEWQLVCIMEFLITPYGLKYEASYRPLHLPNRQIQVGLCHSPICKPDSPALSAD